MAEKKSNQELLDNAHRVAKQQLVTFSEEDRWTQGRTAIAAALLKAYFFGALNTAETIDRLEKGLNQRALRAVRGRFAIACYMNHAIADTPGQDQHWFNEAFDRVAAVFRGNKKR